MSLGQGERLEQMHALAEIGASLCCYLPGAGNPDEWPHARCDCKYLPGMLHLGLNGEQTGCCEVRAAWRALDTLREQADAVTRAADV